MLYFTVLIYTSNKPPRMLMRHWHTYCSSVKSGRGFQRSGGTTRLLNFYARQRSNFLFLASMLSIQASYPPRSAVF